MYCSKCGKKINEGKCDNCNKQYQNNEYLINIVNSTSFYVVNLIYFVLGFSIMFITFDMISDLDILVVTLSIILSIVAIFYNIANQLLFVKAKLPWWGVYIPFYSAYLASKLSFKNGWYFLIPFIPIILAIINVYLVVYMNINNFTTIVNIISYLVPFIYTVISSYMLGKRFGMNGWLIIFFSYITLPIIAFSKVYQYKDEL